MFRMFVYAVVTLGGPYAYLERGLCREIRGWRIRHYFFDTFRDCLQYLITKC